MKGIYCDNDFCVLLKENEILLDFSIFKTSGDVVVSICVAYRRPELALHLSLFVSVQRSDLSYFCIYN